MTDRPGVDLTVAVVGTGRMGSAMAERLAAGGFAVAVYNRTPERASALAERIGATVAATPADAAARQATSASRWWPTTRRSRRSMAVPRASWPAPIRVVCSST